MTHVEGRVDPIADAETVETELMLADLDSLERRVPNLVKKAQQGDKEAKIEASVLGQALELLRASKPARLTQPKDDEEAKALAARAAADGQAGPLRLQRRRGRRRRRQCPVAARVRQGRRRRAPSAVVVSAAIEAEIATLPADEREAFLVRPRPPRNRPRPGDPRRLRPARPDHLLHRRARRKRARGRCTKGAKAPEAAGEIHTDFERGFIRAETIAYDDFVKFGGEAGARDAGKLRSEGKEYVVHDGDVMLFRFNV